ncbi:transposase [Blastopirellula sp. JC732]|uniref:Transposase n=1 Tax=Blastopirellula sediminis TaxID=2894196 RepID=A0A9X1MPN0_9BACT|nr:transposase [Blastopirellula sediminis]MCC9606565.1 transposase [Blastopirellula sediminis]MCC9630137.1 transposase [Blastopirellula sediminis]
MSADLLFSADAPPTSAYLMTWTTQGTWFFSDQVQSNLTLSSRRAASISLSIAQRELVEQAIADCCQQNGWSLVAANCRSNHVHAMVSATIDPQEILRALKEAAALQLNQAAAPRESWWEKGGNVRSLNNDIGIQAAMFYIRVILQRM